MNKIGVFIVLPNLKLEKANEIAKHIQNVLGANVCEELYLVKERDLTKKKLLKPIPARKLIKYWNESSSC